MHLHPEDVAFWGGLALAQAAILILIIAAARGRWAQ